MKLPIYFDNHATTPVDPRVVQEMLPFFTEKFGNIASNHVFGKAVRSAVQKAREQVAAVIGAAPDEIIFTSGATESNNLVLKGVSEVLCEQGRHIITNATEHNSVLDPCRYLEKNGFTVTYLGVDRFGHVSLESLQRAIRPDTILISIMAANNEIGTLQPIEQVGAVARSRGIAFHVDAAQAVGKIALDVARWQIDLLSISAHKIYGPKGIGALFLREGFCLPKPCCQIHGGGQERGFRSGTLPVPLIVALGKAAELMLVENEMETSRLRALRNRLHQGIQSVTEVHLNGHPEQRLSGNLNVTFHHLDSDDLQLALKDVAVSSTSACSSNGAKPSHVLLAIGLKPEQSFSSIRFGLGRFNTEEEVDFVVNRISEVQRKSGNSKKEHKAKVKSLSY